MIMWPSLNYSHGTLSLLLFCSILFSCRWLDVDAHENNEVLVDHYNNGNDNKKRHGSRRIFHRILQHNGRDGTTNNRSSVRINSNNHSIKYNNENKRQSGNTPGNTQYSINRHNVNITYNDRYDDTSTLIPLIINNSHRRTRLLGEMVLHDSSPKKLPPAPLQYMFDTLLQLQKRYGTDLITVRDATEVYPILLGNGHGQSTHENRDDDCPFTYVSTHVTSPQSSNSESNLNRNNKKPCYTPIATIHDKISNSRKDSPPQILLLGGSSPEEDLDDTGPLSIVGTVALLLECAHCESLSPWVTGKLNTAAAAEGGGIGIGPSGNNTPEIHIAHENEKQNHSKYNNAAIKCRASLTSRGITDDLRKWLARLVATREIVSLPVADTEGYFNAFHRIKEKQNEQQQQQQQQHSNGHDFETAMPGILTDYDGGDFPFPLHWKQKQQSSACSLNSSDSTFTPSCMTTFSSRLLNEVLRSHAFQIGVAFHTSTHEAFPPRIEIPSWRTKNTNTYDNTPNTLDERAMMDIARAFGDLSESTDVESNDRSNNLYSVRINYAEQKSEKCNNSNHANGAMFEPFAFSAGMVAGEGLEATNEGLLWMEQCQCHPLGEGGHNETHNINARPNEGGSCSYPSQQTSHYDGSSLRAFVARVVSSPFATPFDSYDDGLFAATTLGSNIRMSLLATELVEPYTIIRSVAGVALRDDDAIPSSPRVPGACRKTRTIVMPETSPQMKETVVEWTVGGALEVAETAIMYGKWDVLDGKIFDCVTQPTKQELDAFFTILRDFEIMGGETAEEMAEDVNFSPVQNGFTRWHHSEESTSSTTIPPETTFSISLDLHHYKAGDIIAVYSLARVDQGWAFDDRDSQSVAPQSNIVNARTNPQWHHVRSDLVLRGRHDWFSVPVTIEIGPQPGFFERNVPVEKSVRITDEGFSGLRKKTSVSTIVRSLMLAFVVMAGTMCCVFCREGRDGTDIFSIWSEHRRITKQKISMDQFFKDESLELRSMS